jgi:hypothetical protein
MLLLASDRICGESLEFLERAIVEGRPAHEYGRARDPRFGSLFDSAMANASTSIMREFLDSRSSASCLDRVHVLIDVGGGLGWSLNLIVSRFPHIRGINFDQPHVVDQAPSYPGLFFYDAIKLVLDN